MFCCSSNLITDFFCITFILFATLRFLYLLWKTNPNWYLLSGQIPLGWFKMKRKNPAIRVVLEWIWSEHNPSNLFRHFIDTRDVVILPTEKGISCKKIICNLFFLCEKTMFIKICGQISQKYFLILDFCLFFHVNGRHLA